MYQKSIDQETINSLIKYFGLGYRGLILSSISWLESHFPPYAKRGNLRIDLYDFLGPIVDNYKEKIM